MIRSLHGLHHYHKRERQASESRMQRFVDSIVYVVIGFGLVMTLPQLKKIWIDHNAAGVSAITWGAYEIASLFWLFYGIVHKQKPIVLSS